MPEVNQLSFLQKGPIKQIEDNIITIFVIIICLIFIMFVIHAMKKQKKNCQNIKSIETNSMAFYSFQQLIQSNYFKSGQFNNYTCKLKDFYIKASYNSFCSGSFRTDYVDKCALVNCAKHGVRALDMQIFSLNGVPVVAANANDSNDEKSTYNSIELKTAVQYIDELFLTQSENNQRDQSNDPLFLNFRLHYGSGKGNVADAVSKKKKFYNSIHDAIISGLQDKLRLFSLYQREYISDYDVKREHIVTNIPFDYCYKRIFIFVSINGERNTDIVKETTLNNIVDLYKNDYGLSTIRNDDISEDSLVTYNSTSKRKIVMCLPPLGNKSGNYDFTKAFSNGIQFVAMNFQTADPNLGYYNDFFKSQIGSSSQNMSSPYIKKEDAMIDSSNADESFYQPNFKYMIHNEQLTCENASDKSALECGDQCGPDQNYQFFKFEQQESGDYAFKSFATDKYCDVSTNNEIMCDDTTIGERGLFSLTKIGYYDYLIQDRDGSYCSISGDSDNGAIVCNVENNASDAFSKFTIIGDPAPMPTPDNC